MLKKKVTWVSLLALLFANGIQAQYNGLVPESVTLELGAGTALMYDSQLRGTPNVGRPKLIYLAYYLPYSIFSVKGGYDFGTAFKVGDFNLSYELAFLNLEASVPIAEGGVSDFSFFGFLGPTFQKNLLSIRTEDFLVGDPDQVATTIGFNTGAGFRGRTSSWTFSLYGHLIFNNADFQDGTSDAINFLTGGERIIFSVGYIIKNGRNEVATCPAYY